MPSKVKIRGTVRGVEFRGTAEFHDGQPGEGPKLVGIVWSVDPGLNADDYEGWISVADLAWNVYMDGPSMYGADDPDPNVVW